MEETEGQVQVKPTWRLAWGLWWKMCLISLGVSLLVNLILWFALRGWLLEKMSTLFNALSGGT